MIFFNTHKNITTLGFIVISLATINSQAASLQVDIYDGDQQPIRQVVAALLPKEKIDYRAQSVAIMDQKNNTFVPGVLAIRVNTLVTFPNSDNIRHHVYSFSPAKRFELKLYHGKTAEPVLFDKPGRVVLGCNIHDSMLANIYVVDSEYYGISDSNGKIIINNIVAGEYELEIQHPQLDENKLANSKMIFVAEENRSIQITLSDVKPKVESSNSENNLKTLFKRNY